MEAVLFGEMGEGVCCRIWRGGMGKRVWEEGKVHIYGSKSGWNGDWIWKFMRRGRSGF